MSLKTSFLVQASYRLAREFGWTPSEVQSLTMAQILIYLQMLEEDKIDDKS